MCSGAKEDGHGDCTDRLMIQRLFLHQHVGACGRIAAGRSSAPSVDDRVGQTGACSWTDLCSTRSMRCISGGVFDDELVHGLLCTCSCFGCTFNGETVGGVCRCKP